MLKLPTRDLSGEQIAHLQWPREKAGTRVFQEVLGYLTPALFLFVLFLIAILVAGSLEAGPLCRLAPREMWNATCNHLLVLFERAGLLNFPDAQTSQQQLPLHST
jgi:hypothetical protein